jgi:hypothetical protein
MDKYYTDNSNDRKYVDNKDNYFLKKNEKQNKYS